ncbi:hypothetical protein QOZ80_4BG0339680 [Eleusine coracana subsp. coracana]|nr:hypothetical protein QOZ80_4BG0339680 [Eleusine coracana subsp. coracana]
MACIYSKKSFHPRTMFEDMKLAWGIPDLAPVEKLADKVFLVSFASDEEKKRVVEGGPWRHKGDTLIVVAHDRLVRPSEVKIHSIALWVRFYDLSPKLMNNNFAERLGGQLGTVIKVDTWVSRYLRVRVNFSLRKALVPEMSIRIRDRGMMAITLRYENVPHFCFACGRIGHAKMNCEEEADEDLGIRFSEELRASPPRRQREIRTKATTTGAATKHLSFTTKEKGSTSTAGQGRATDGGVKVGVAVNDPPKEEAMPHINLEDQGIPYEVATDLVKGENRQKGSSLAEHDTQEADMQEPFKETSGLDRKERVSFLTNMTTDEESEDSGAVHRRKGEGKTVVDRFHARKFGIKPGSTAEKRAALGVANKGREIEKSKKQKTPVKVNIKELVEAGLQLVANLRDVKLEHEENPKAASARQAAAPSADPHPLTGP